MKITHLCAALATVALCGLSAPVFAYPIPSSSGDANANANANASAGAFAGGSNSAINQGDSYANGGIGADGCAASIMTPVLGFSVPTCNNMHNAEFALKVFMSPARHMFSDADYAEVLAGGMGRKVVHAKPVAASMSAPAAKPAKAAFPNVVGADWKKLSHKQQKAVMTCAALWNGDKIQGCAY